MESRATNFQENPMLHFTNCSDYPPVFLEKIATAPNPVTHSSNWDDWIHGSTENQASLPVSYTLSGYLMAPIRVGEAIVVFRTNRNGVEATGVFHSTPVMEIREGDIVETFNSIYRVTYGVMVGKEAP